jgi:hypothetical protein
MRKGISKILAIVLGVVLLASAGPSISSEAASTKKLDKKVLYMHSASESYVNLGVDGIKKLSGLSSNSNNIRPTSYYYNDYANYNVSGTKLEETSNGARIGINLLCKKQGDAKIKFKCAGKNYVLPVTVKKYVNALNSITITNVNSGKNIKSKFNKQAKLLNEKSLVLAKNGTVKVSAKANSGWKIKYICIKNNKSDSNTGYRHSISMDYYNGVQNASVKLPGYIAAHGGNVEITLENQTDKGEINISCDLVKKAVKK